MIVALASLTVTLATVLSVVPLLRWQAREHTRERHEWMAERRDLNDRLAHAHGRDWTLPPREITAPDEPDLDLVADPEQAAY